MNRETSEGMHEFNWLDVWSRMDAAERQMAAEAFVRWLRAGPEELVKGYAPGFLRAFARHMHFRPETILRMQDAKLARQIQKNLPAFFDHRDWALFFQCFYMQHKVGLMCRFLDLCGIPRDEEGGVREAFEAPRDIAPVVTTLIGEYGEDEVIRYLMVLCLHLPEAWSFVMPVLSSLLSRQARSAQSQEPAEQEEKQPSVQELADEFTQLDRVLIDQIIATAAGEERGLSPEQLQDLVETVHALDTRRNRTYFHLGFMDALLPEQEPSFDRPEMNDARRQWYLAGLLAGYARRRDKEKIAEWIAGRQSDFMRAAQVPGGAGRSMAKTLFGFLLELDMLSPAIVLLRGQVTEAGPDMRWFALDHASERLRAGDIASAKALLALLHEKLSEIAFVEPEEHDDFLSRVQRKLGQCYQAAGDFSRASTLFDQLIKSDTTCSADLLADMGLVAAGFSSLQEVVLEGDEERRTLMRQALRKGEARFNEAVEQFGSNAHHAHYVLAVLRYLDFMDGGQESARRKAIGHAESALAGMIGASQAAAYERLGILGRCRFMIAVLRMASLEPAQAPAAKHAWDAITATAGHFPSEHLDRFLENAALVDQGIALEIAESIWHAREADALDFLIAHNWIIESDVLRAAFLELARDEMRPRHERFRLWSLLVPAVLRDGDLGVAEEGLDSLEALVDADSTFADQFLEWLKNVANYDPVWDEADVLKVRYRVFARIGKDNEAFLALRDLFFSLRDRRPDEARQIRELFAIRKAPSELYEDLFVPESEDLATQTVQDAEERLCNGEKVRVLFVGGNEIQAQYDDTIRRRINADWPGVEIAFEHTGWSSNWGREMDRLKREAARSDAVVLMSMMRTMLGRKLREALNDPPRPWVPCTGTGRKALEDSIRTAARIAAQARV